jgi:cytochrome P450
MASEETLVPAAAMAAPPAPAPAAPSSAFTLSDLESHGLREKIVDWILDEPQWLLALFRRFWPIPKFPGKQAMATRYDDVQEVMRRDREFEVPWGDRVQLINGGPNFLLGMPAGEDYRQILKHIMAAFRREDVEKIVTPLATRFASEIVEGSGGHFDAIEDLIARVPVRVVEEYYGVKIVANDPARDRAEFAHWCLAASAFTFGNPDDKAGYRRAAVAAGERLRPLIDASIAAAKATPGGDTILARLVAEQPKSGLSDLVLRSYIIGMIMGFVPTDRMAAGKALEQLLRRPDFLARAQAAARAGDDDLLRRCIREAMRFKPIFIGPQRKCVADCTLAEGTPRATRIRRGTKMLPSTQSAMFDERRVKDPYDFNPDRAAADYMLFGHALHWCVGAFIAEAQITQTLKPLLARPGLRRARGSAGKLTLIGGFPHHLWVEFDR